MALIVFVIFVFLFFWCRHQLSKGLLANWPFVGMMPGLILNRHCVHNYATKILEQGGWTVEFKGPWFSNVDMILTSDPANIHYILTKKASNFPKGAEFKKLFALLGDGIIIAEGKSWEIQRKTTNSLFHHPSFQKLVRTKTWSKVEKGLFPVLVNCAKLGTEVDLQELLQRLTCDVNCDLIVDHDPGSLFLGLPDFKYKQAFFDAEEAVFARHYLPEPLWQLQKWLQIGKEKKMTLAEKSINEFLADCIASKHEKIEDADSTMGDEEDYFDFFTSYMKTLKENSGQLEVPEKARRDTLLNLLFAGKDANAAGMTWFFWLMATNPFEENKIREEILTNLHVQEDGSLKFPSEEEMKNMIYLHAALCEALRLFPPIALQHKGPIEADILPTGHHVKPNTKIVMSLYTMGRMEEIWGKDCLQYKPERWISETGGIKHVSSYKFTVFDAGPRSCVGKEMALMQLKLVAVEVIHNFVLEVVEGHCVSPSNSVILNMKHGLKVKVRKRHVYQ